MEQLTRTPFFSLLTGQNGEKTSAKETELQPAYKKFTQQVTRLCVEDNRETPVFFILNYTRIELAQLQNTIAGKEKKASNNSIPA